MEEKNDNNPNEHRMEFVTLKKAFEQS